MATKLSKPEEIVSRLSQVEVLMGQGMSPGVQTYHNNVYSMDSADEKNVDWNSCILYY